MLILTLPVSAASTSLGLKLAAGKRPSVAGSAVFGNADAEEEEAAELARKRSKIVPMKYTDAELRAAGRERRGCGIW